jgi:hypothetical protein
MPNILDLSGKTKQLWSGQASLRRSRRKNQTKTMSPFVRRDLVYITAIYNYLITILLIYNILFISAIHEEHNS